MRRMITTVGLAVSLAAGSVSVGHAQSVSATETARFDVYFAGLKAGELHYGMTRKDGGYSAKGRVFSTGLIGALADFRFKASARGRLKGGRFIPTRYVESSDTGRRKNDAVLRYPGGVPTLESKEKPKEYWLDPSRQGDALDPLTAVWQVLRDREGDDLCQADVSYFDGARRVRLVTGSETRDGDKVTCDGHYIRVGGYSKKRLKEGKRFPFTVTYEQVGDDDRYRVSRVSAKALRGKVLLIRR